MVGWGTVGIWTRSRPHQQQLWTEPKENKDECMSMLCRIVGLTTFVWELNQNKLAHVSSSQSGLKDSHIYLYLYTFAWSSVRTGTSFSWDELCVYTWTNTKSIIPLSCTVRQHTEVSFPNPVLCFQPCGELITTNFWDRTAEWKPIVQRCSSVGFFFWYIQKGELCEKTWVPTVDCFCL